MNDNNYTTERIFNPIDGVGVKIIEYLGDDKTVHIPLRINKILVLAIGENTFANKQLETVTLPTSVKHILHNSFPHNLLTNIEIPIGVTYIGQKAFEGNKLDTVIFHQNLTTIGRKAFADNELTSIEIPEKVTLIGKHAFAGNKITSITIGADVYIENDDIGDPDFIECYNQNGKAAGVYEVTNEKWTKVN